MCQMPNIWHIWHSKHKNGALSDVPNLKNYVILLQYRLKYETIWTTMAKWDIIILLHFSLSSSVDISLSVNSILFLISLSLPISSLSSLLKKVSQDHSQESCRRSHRLTFQSLPPISPVLVVDLTASFSTTRRRSRRPKLRFWLIWWVLGFDLGWGYGWWVRWLRWVRLKLWVMASMGWFRWFRLRLWVAVGSWIAFEIGFWFGLRFWVELRWLDFGERWVTVTVLCLWLWLRGGRGRLVVAELWVFFLFLFFAVVGGC